MTSKFLLAAASAGLLFGAVHSAAAAEAKGPRPTAAVGKNLQAAQTANNKKDFPAALAAVEAAKQVSDRTPYDNYLIARFASSIHIGMKELDAATGDAEAAAEVDPAVIPDAEKASVYNTAMQLALRAKHDANAAKYAKLFLATTPPPTGQDLDNVVVALYQGGDYATATSIAQKNVETATAAGKKPAFNDLQVIMNSQIKQKDEPGAEKTLETMISNYNRPDDWSNIMGVALTTKGMRDIDYVYMGRLMFLQSFYKVRPEDASLIGSNASRMGFFGDAEQAEKIGGTGFPPATPKVAADKKDMPAQIAAGAKQNGEYNVKLAETLYGYGMYPEALKAAQLAKSKGGAKDPTEPDMVIGMAQTAAGQYADAATTFGAINQSNPASARVVRLWGYLAKAKANPSAAAAN